MQLVVEQLLRSLTFSAVDWEFVATTPDFLLFKLFFLNGCLLLRFSFGHSRLTSRKSHCWDASMSPERCLLEQEKEQVGPQPLLERKPFCAHIYFYYWKLIWNANVPLWQRLPVFTEDNGRTKVWDGMVKVLRKVFFLKTFLAWMEQLKCQFCIFNCRSTLKW